MGGIIRFSKRKEPMTFNQLKRAIIAKTSKKENMPDWYYSRLQKCIVCDHNSGNKDKLTMVDRLRISHNFGKNSCLVCSCGISDKCSDPIESCPINKWTAQDLQMGNDMYKITNLSEDKVTMEKQGIFYELDYGEIKHESDSEITLNIELTGAKDHTVKSSCGCTVPTVTKVGEDLYPLKISYDTKRTGQFKKTVRFEYKKLNIKNQINFIIKGTVIK